LIRSFVQSGKAKPLRHVVRHGCTLAGIQVTFSTIEHAHIGHLRGLIFFFSESLVWGAHKMSGLLSPHHRLLGPCCIQNSWILAEMHVVRQSISVIGPPKLCQFPGTETESALCQIWEDEPRAHDRIIKRIARTNLPGEISTLYRALLEI
jgi:hypothetical protein